MKEWRDVVGYEGIYQVSNDGEIKRIKPSRAIKTAGNILKPRIRESGHMSVRLYGDLPGKGGRHAYKVCWVHRLVLEAFLCSPLPGQVANHKNGNASDNRIENLEWVTQRENLVHSYEVLGNASKLPRGEDHHKTYFTDEQILEIRRLRSQGMYQTTLAKKFSTSQHTIWSIVHKKTWAHVKEKD